jgi:hypothetical protein
MEWYQDQVIYFSGEIRGTKATPKMVLGSSAGENGFVVGNLRTIGE